MTTRHSDRHFKPCLTYGILSESSREAISCASTLAEGIELGPVGQSGDVVTKQFSTKLSLPEMKQTYKSKCLNRVEKIIAVQVFVLQMCQLYLIRGSHALDLCEHDMDDKVFSSWTPVFFSVGQLFMLVIYLVFSRKASKSDSLSAHIRGCLLFAWSYWVIRPACFAADTCWSDTLWALVMRQSGRVAYSVYKSLFVFTIVQRLQLLSQAWYKSRFVPDDRARMTFVVQLLCKFLIASLFLAAVTAALGDCLMLNFNFEYCARFALLTWCLVDALQIAFMTTVLALSRKLYDEMFTVYANRKSELRMGSEYLHSEIRWAVTVLQRTFKSLMVTYIIEIAAACVTIFTTLNVAAHFRTWRAETFAKIVGFYAASVVPFIDSLSLILLVGMFSKSRPEIGLHSQWHQGSDSMPFTKRRSDKWQAKVESLAGRSITAEAVLHFYASLGCQGSSMPHFHPLRSTTNDVVRCAVIPMSKKGSTGRPYADVVTNSETPVFPRRMVTHTWSSLFLFLVAAVIADALEIEDGFADVARTLLAGHFQVLFKRLQEREVHDQTYWLCIFCVNQHSCICSGFAPEPPRADVQAHMRWDRSRRDSVSRSIFKLCNCENLKFFSDQADECEMNAFDEMMAFVHARVPDLRQVIAVDQDYSIFFRVWCVAELVIARTAGIEQKVQLLSSLDFDLRAKDLGIYTKLVHLSVEDCAASMPEDKADIMMKIGDSPENIAEFNTYLQKLILGDNGLLRKEYQGFESVEAAVLVLRRAMDIVS